MPSASWAEPSAPRVTENRTTGTRVLSRARLTLSEVVEMREKDVSVVARREPLEVVFAHLAQLLPVDILEEQDVDVGQAVFFHRPLQPLPDVVRTPQRGI